ncbi:hypothetical protein LOTGIDRAFT_190960 [Lottia gigantea]|uniref:Uncharacterized protein n=1 Tax=Lottia gigantea TaxID=225164 RepID=V3ZLK1_LOTGI|nr:hypothetical protein LOTGIDRAFT_190960 [Lottia gigantea]ESO92223.1 hypothetical protein LOTGIDRAFT_190960 [Lottia gigantea]
MELMCCESENIQLSYEDPVLLNDHRVLQNLLATEDKYVPNTCYFSCVQKDIKPFMRKMVTQWMLEVCEEQRCEVEVFPLAVNYLDRVLCVRDINRSTLQLLGSACLFLASKLKETIPLTAEKIVNYTDYSIRLTELMAMESRVLQCLKWDLSAVTPHDFLQQILPRLDISLEKSEILKRHAQTFIALCATDCNFMLSPPSMIAAGSVGAALQGLQSPCHSKFLQKLHQITGIELDSLRLCQEQIEQTVNCNLMNLVPDPPHTPTKSDPLNQQPTTPTDVRQICV